MKKLLKALALLLGFAAVTMTIYWFNLDNKLIYYVIRPLLNKLYDRKARGGL